MYSPLKLVRARVPSLLCANSVKDEPSSEFALLFLHFVVIFSRIRFFICFTMLSDSIVYYSVVLTQLCITLWF